MSASEVGFRGVQVSGVGFKGACFTGETDFVTVLLMQLIIMQMATITIMIIIKDQRRLVSHSAAKDNPSKRVKNFPQPISP